MADSEARQELEAVTVRIGREVQRLQRQHASGASQALTALVAQAHGLLDQIERAENPEATRETVPPKLSEEELSDVIFTPGTQLSRSKSCDRAYDRLRYLESAHARTCEWTEDEIEGDSGLWHKVFRSPHPPKTHSHCLPNFCPECGGKIVTK